MWPDHRDLSIHLYFSLSLLLVLLLLFLITVYSDLKLCTQLPSSQHSLLLHLKITIAIIEQRLLLYSYGGYL